MHLYRLLLLHSSMFGSVRGCCGNGEEGGRDELCFELPWGSDVERTRIEIGRGMEDVWQSGKESVTTLVDVMRTNG